MNKKILFISITLLIFALALLLFLLFGNVFSSVKQVESTETVSGYHKSNGYSYVDLGLSVKWAACNMGANTPEEYGSYYAWGEVKEKEDYTWRTYKWCKGTQDRLKKYNTLAEYNKVDNKTTLELSDDAARAKRGASWRIPTEAEWDELKNSCKWRRTTQKDTNGFLITAPNGNSIFLPFAGCLYFTTYDELGRYGLYWTSTLDEEYPTSAKAMILFDEGCQIFNYLRAMGLSIRPVLAE